MTKKDKILAIAKKALYQIERGETGSPMRTAHWALTEIAALKIAGGKKNGR